MELNGGGGHEMTFFMWTNYRDIVMNLAVSGTYMHE